MLGQQGLDIVEQLRSGEQIEERVGIGALALGENVTLLPRGGTLTRMHVGWALGDGRFGLVTSNLPSPPAFSNNFSDLSLN